MKQLNLDQMQLIVGGLDKNGWRATGLMCAGTAILLATPGLQPIAAATGAGCITGLFAMFS